MTDNTQDTTGRRGLFGDPGRIAPHIDKDWRDRFIIEARLQGVDGTAIGDALVTADTHVQESGESAQEAFGDPTQYARDTAAASIRSPGTGMSRAAVLGVLIGLIGMFGAVSAAGAWQEGRPVSITTGTPVALTLLMALTTIVIALQGAFLRLAVERRIPFAFGVPVVVTALFVGIFLLFRQELFAVGAGTAGLISVALLAVSSLLLLVGLRDDDDLIAAPGDPRTPSMASRAVVPLILPGMTLLMAVGFWLTFSVFG